MAVRSITLRDSEVRALLAGRKTQHRLVVKRPSALNAIWVFGPSFLLLPGNVDLLPCAPGDLLWVQESWSDQDCCKGEVLYRATAIADGLLRDEVAETRWRPAAQMSRWASRLTLEVTAVKVERLNDIGEADAQAEGVPWQDCWPSYRQSFESLWTRNHGQDAWDRNPWVAATTFAVRKANVDDLLSQPSAPLKEP